MIDLRQGDCLKLIKKVYSQHNKDKIIIVTDPPFNIGYKYNSYKDNLKEEEYYKMLCKLLKGNKSVIIHYPENLHKLSIKLKNATKKVYLEATDNGGKDRGVCVGTYQYAKSDKFMNGKDRLQLGKETSNTLQTSPKEGVVTIGNYSPSNHEASRIIDSNYSAPTFKENHGTITAIQSNDLRIRKLTPRECGRLMGVKDKDITNMLKNQSNSSAYHCFGDSIICTVLCAIFGELLDKNWKEYLWKV